MSISSIQALNIAIQSSNPFEPVPMVKEPDIWGSGLTDVTSLNESISNQVFQTIEQVKHRSNKVITLAIAANRGTGKSHLIKRIRQRLQSEGNVLFSYINAHQFTDLNIIRYQFLQTLVDSWRHLGNQGVMQWQIIATEMANQAIKIINPQARNFLAKDLIKKLDINTLDKNQTWVNQLTEAYFRIKPDVSDPDLVRAIFWTLANSQAPFAIKWLSGKMLAQWKIEELGLPNPSRDGRESEAFDTLLHLINIINPYQGLIICFDELDSYESSDNGLKRERIVASLVKHLSERLTTIHLNLGVVILTVMTPETWIYKIKPLPVGISERLSSQGNPLELNEINTAQIVELVSLWLKKFYDQKGVKPPTNIYPFDLDQLQALGREKLNVRQVLQWCSENFRTVEVDPLERVEQIFNEAIAEIRINLDNDLEQNHLVANALYLGLISLQGKTVEGVTIEVVSNEIKHKADHQDYLNFRVIGRENGQVVKIGVAILQDDRGKRIGAGLKRLIDYQHFDLTRGCLVRSQTKKIKHCWKAYNYLTQLTLLGGKWVDLKAEDIKPLMVIWSIYQQREHHQLEPGQIFEFMFQRKLASENLLIRAILSEPAHQGTVTNLAVPEPAMAIALVPIAAEPEIFT